MVREEEEEEESVCVVCSIVVVLEVYRLYTSWYSQWCGVVASLITSSCLPTLSTISPQSPLPRSH